MQSGDNLIDRSVISLSEGAVLGVIREFYLDQALEFVAGIQIGGSEGFLGLGSERGTSLIGRNSIAVFGIDAILLAEEADTLRTESSLPGTENWVQRNALKGRNVNTPGGTRVGIIGDIIFNEEGRILGFKLQQTLVRGPIEAAQAIAREVVINLGHEDGIMTIDLAGAEQQGLNTAHLGK